MALTKSAPSQQFVPLKEVRDGIAILKDGSMRALLLTSSLNFALKSAESQEAIIYQFQNFLNSLDFTVQIFVSSRRLDIRPYIALLENRYKEQTGELLRLQTREYIEFIKKFTESANIMTKSFFVVVPYGSAVLNKNSASGLFSKKDKQKETAQKSEAFEEAKSQIQQRVSVVEQGLTRVGIRVAQLGTEEIIELFYKIFNPGETDKPIQL
ncbi:MAG: hypothetical protein AAB391_03030 [Patescibacteria group bacterium]